MMHIETSVDVHVKHQKTKIIEIAKNQLHEYLKHNKSSQLRDDIEGYNAVLLSKEPEHNAKWFLNIKQSPRFKNQFKSNLEIVDYLKVHQMWNNLNYKG